MGEGLTLREVIRGGARGRLVAQGFGPKRNRRGPRIRDLADTLRVPASVADALVTRGLDFEGARAELVREAAARGPRIDARGASYVTRESSPADHARALGEALAFRYGANNSVSELGRPYVQDRFPQIARRLLDASGISTTGLSEAAIVKRHTHTLRIFPF